jgi:hypothetical protein
VRDRMEVRDGVEPSLRGLQPRALPLGYQTRALRAGIEPATLALTGRRTTIVLPENRERRADDGDRTRLGLPGKQVRHRAASSAKARPETRERRARRRGIEPR